MKILENRCAFCDTKAFKKIDNSDDMTKRICGVCGCIHYRDGLKTRYSLFKLYDEELPEINTWKTPIITRLMYIVCLQYTWIDVTFFTCDWFTKFQDDHPNEEILIVP